MLRSRLDALAESEEQLRHELAEREAELAATAHDLRKMIHENQVRPRRGPWGKVARWAQCRRGIVRGWGDAAKEKTGSEFILYAR
jgi:C4-dicarboxylate-specific signal transduction histidine kinase